MRVIKRISCWPIAFMNIAFMALIGFAIYYLESGSPLWALLLGGWSCKKDDDEE